MYEKAPPGTPDSIIAAARSDYEKLFSDHTATFDVVDNALRTHGMALNPYRIAYEAFYALHGKLLEEKYIMHGLSSMLSAKYENFLRDGGSLENFRKGSEFEEYFLPDEKYELGVAEHAAHERTEDKLRELIANKHEEFVAKVESARESQNRMLEKIKVLEGLAERGKTWKDELSRRIEVFKNSLAGLESPFREADLDAAITYYYDAIKLTDEPIQVVDSEQIPV